MTSKLLSAVSAAFLALTIALLPVMSVVSHAQDGDDIQARQVDRSSIPLLQPLDGSNNQSIDVDQESGLNIFIQYFESSADWLFAVAVGIAVIWILIGGFEIMLSGGGSGKETGKQHITWAIIGIVLLNFAGFILRTINSLFFT